MEITVTLSQKCCRYIVQVMLMATTTARWETSP